MMRFACRLTDLAAASPRWAFKGRAPPANPAPKTDAPISSRRVTRLYTAILPLCQLFMIYHFAIGVAVMVASRHGKIGHEACALLVLRPVWDLPPCCRRR